METRKTKYQNYRLSLGQKNDDVLKSPVNDNKNNDNTLPMEEVMSEPIEEKVKHKDQRFHNMVIYTIVVGALILALLIVLIVLAFVYF